MTSDSAPIDYIITHRYGNIDMSDSEWNYLIDMVTWKRPPTFKVRGRSAWHVFEEKVTLKSDPTCCLRAAKLKGVGVWNPEAAARNRDSLMVPISDTAIPPTTIPLKSFSTYPHFGYTSSGDFSFVHGRLAPVGGMLHDAAVREFETAQHLVEHGISSIVPLMVVQYTDPEKYSFAGQPMGAVVSLSPSVDPYRLSEIQFGAAAYPGSDPKKEAYCNQVKDSLGISGELSNETTRLQMIQTLSRQVGKLIHDFSASGLYRYSPEWTNLEYDLNSCQVVLTDLDSTRPMRELTPEFQGLQAIRDATSLLYRTMAKFATPLALDKYTLANLLKYDPIIESLKSYFPEAKHDQLQGISDRLWHAFIPYLFQLKKYRSQIRDEWDNERRRSYKMGHDLFYILAMASILPLYDGSALADLYPERITMDQLHKKAKAFLGEQYDYFVFLLNYRS